MQKIRIGVDMIMKFSKSLCIFIVTGVCLLVTFSSQAEVYVSEKLGFKLPSALYQIAAGTMHPIELNGGDTGIEYQIVMNSSGSTFDDVRLAVCKNSQHLNYISGVTRACSNKDFTGAIQFTHKVKAGEKSILIIDNSSALITSKKVLVDIYANLSLSSNQKQEIEVSLRTALDGIHEFFEVDKFDLSLLPCGQSNAFSSTDDGDITMCSELLFDTETKGLKNAFTGIFSHELGHTLLNLWGDPHYDNELAADNFAAALLLIGENFEYESLDESQEDASAEEVIRDMIKYFESIENTSLEAQAALLGSQHPLSIQRINNFKKILLFPKKTAEKWTSEIYPHLTVVALKSIIQQPHVGADVEFAKILLERKKACGSVSLEKCIINPQ